MNSASAAQPLVSVVMPCLNEEEGVGVCIEKIQRTFRENGIDGEVVVCDNGSTDQTAAIAEKMGARVVHQPLRGYGNAYLKGFEHARGKILVMGDADDTYDFTQIPAFLALMREGRHDFVTGSRFLSGEKLDHNPLLHRLFGNPALTRLLNLLFGARYTDVYCGFRSFTREAYEKIRPVSPGMEFNLELAINAVLARLSIAEIPIRLHPRLGDSKLRTFHDGWRSLRMMLLYSPNKLFLIPGLSLLLAGLALHVGVLGQWIQYQGRPLGAATGMVALLASVLGMHILSLGLHAKTYSWSRRFDRNNAFLERFYKRFSLEKGLILGGGLFSVATLGMAAVVWQWVQSDLQPLARPELVTFLSTLMIFGVQIAFVSLFISAMSIQSPERG